jgi:putative ABC transport system permease protein
VAWTAAAEVTDLAVALVREHLGGSMDATVQDVKVGVRSLRRTPMVTAMAVLSLALGIGATTALFSALDVWLWRPLPVPNQSRLVHIGLSHRERGWQNLSLSLADFKDFREAARTVDLAVYRRIGASLSTGGTAEEVTTIRGSANLPTVLGVRPALGRAFRPDEEMAGTPGTALLTDAFWRTAWNADPSVLGRSLMIDGEPYTVVGVLPPRSTLPTMEADIWIPLRLTGEETRRSHSWQALGLPHPGQDLAAVQEDMETAATAIVRAHPDVDFTDADVQSLHDFYATGPFRQGTYAIGSSVLFVLLIACANIANLLLARGVGRTHEMAVRGASGAGRGRVVRQLLTENVILAAMGGLAGVGVAYVGIRLLVGFVFPPSVQGLEYIELNGRVLTAAVVLTVASALFFGLVPSWRTSRVDLRARLADGGRGTMGAGRGRLGTALVAGEIGLAIALLATTALVVRSLLSMNRVDMGFRTDDALTFAVTLPERSYPDPGAIRTFHAALASRIGELPGVVAVGANTTPAIGGFSSESYAVGDRADGDVREHEAWLRHSSQGYLRAMGMHLVAGRWFDEQVDRPDAPAAVVVSLPLARQEWGSAAAAVGRTLSMSSTGYRVVGVADVGRLMGPQRPSPSVIFVSATQAPSRGMYYVVAVGSGGTEVAAGIRAVLRQLDPDLAMADPSTLGAEVRAALQPEVVVIEILGTLGGLALLLTLVGVYGVVAHSVARRTPEFGLRAALGADPGSILRLVLARSGWLAVGGAAGGLIVAVGLGKLLSAVLVGIRPFDALALGGTALLTVFAAGAASWVPARRAARVDPTRSLQER